MVGRQPIFDRDREVYGYELLFRGPHDLASRGDAMTADVLVHAGLDLGLEELVGPKLAFVNATRSFLVGEQVVPLPAAQTVIEVLEDVAHDDEVVEGCRLLAARGYRIALDDYAWAEGDEPLLEVADIAKVDVLALAPADLAVTVERCAAAGLKLLAEKVETAEMLGRCRDLGFELFQGYLLSRPETVKTPVLSPGRLNCLRIIDRLCDPESSAEDVEEIVEADVGLSQRFLTAVGVGSALGLRRQVSSIREGVVLLGERRLRSWVTLMLLADSGPASSELLQIAMTRARMCELMADIIAPKRAHSAFTVGLVSALGLLVQTPLEQVVEKLAITDDLRVAVLHHDGLLGHILSDVMAWEVGGADLHPVSGVGPAVVETCYLQALSWSTQTCSALGAPD